MFKSLNRGISAPIAIIIIVVCALLVGGIIIWQYLETPEEEEEITEIKPPEGEEEEEEDKTADWNIYRNEWYGFEIRYPTEYRILDSKSSDDHVVIANIEEERIQRETQAGEFSTFIINTYLNEENLEAREWLDENIFLSTGGAKKEWLSDFHYVNVAEIAALQFIVNEMLTPRHTLIRLRDRRIIVDVIGSGIEKGLYDQVLSTFKLVDSEKEKIEEEKKKTACEEIAKEARDLIEELNYCNDKLDCSVIKGISAKDFYPRYYIPINENSDSTKIDKKIEEYTTKCDPQYSTSDIFISNVYPIEKAKEEVECIENKCIVTHNFIKEYDSLDTSGWKTYNSEEFSFKFDCPSGISVRERSSPLSAFVVADRIIIGVRQEEEWSLGKCIEDLWGLRPTGLKKEIDGVDFYYYVNYPEELGSYCGMSGGCSYRDIYRAFYRGYCYELALVDPSDETIEIFNQIFSTIRFTD